MASHEIPSIDEMRAGLIPETREKLDGLIERHKLPPDGEVVGEMVTQAHILQRVGWIPENIGKVRGIYKPIAPMDTQSVGVEQMHEIVEQEIVEEE